jgi:hypothetical protein
MVQDVEQATDADDAHGRKCTCRVRKEDCPAAIDVVVKLDLAHGRVRLEIRHDLGEQWRRHVAN